VTLPAWTREPLVHFLALGALLYVAMTWGGSPPDPASRVINVDKAQQAQLALAFERVMGRAPTDAELDERIARFVREEVLYREALRLGLDADDAVVRQRMVAKMDMTASGAADAAEPSEAELEAWRADHPERFAAKARFTFDQIYFASEDAALTAVLDKAWPGADWRGRGDPISRPASVARMPANEIAVRFGQQFLDGIAAIDHSDSWAGPIPSGFGWHVVRIREYEQSDVPPLDQIRAQVLNDWRAQQIAARKQRAYDILRSAYRVEIDK
jgi:hypothetical protein